MKKTLLLIRHAKSDWSVYGQKDFDRTLNERGNKDALMMSKRLMKRGITPDLIISSTAKRACTTAALIAQETGYDTEKIILMEKLYQSSLDVYENIITQTPIADTINTLFLFGHNNEITDFANYTIPDFTTDTIPTCGMVGLTFKAEQWRDYNRVKRSFLFYDFPKNQ
jgi:phosphohistidine phosphatase